MKSSLTITTNFTVLHKTVIVQKPQTTERIPPRRSNSHRKRHQDAVRCDQLSVVYQSGQPGRRFQRMGSGQIDGNNDKSIIDHLHAC